MEALNSHKTRHRRPSFHTVRSGLPALALCAIALLGLSATAQAKVFPYEFDPTLSLRGNCGAPKTIDPVPDPSCTGSPPEYPPPPNRPQEFERTVAIATNSYGDEYVFSAGTNAKGDERIDVFDDEGRFLTEFTPVSSFVYSMAVDSKGNLYTFDGSGDVKRYSPSAYTPEAGQVEYENAPVTVSTGRNTGSVAIDAANDHLYVARDTITEYGSAEEGNAVVETFAGGSWTEALALDPQRGRIFVSGCRKANEECFVRVLEADAPHAALAEIDGSTTPAGKFAAFSGLLPTAIDEETGRFFIGDLGAKQVYEFEPNFAYRSELTHSLFQEGSGGMLAVSNGENAAGDANNRHYLFVTTTENNRVLAFSPPAVQPPDVKASLSGVSETEATLQATVDPNGADTEYAFQYTSQAAFEAEGFEGAQTAAKGTLSGSSLPKLLSAPLSGLAPGVSYRFRVLAHNEAGDAEPVSEGAFATYNDPTATSQCPNQALRSGAAAALPDCRAFELVTPGETSGREPRGASNSGNVSPFATVLSSSEGNAASFVIQGGSLPGSNGIATINGDPYRATRGPSGWSTVLAGPNGTEATFSTPGSASPDQGYSFWAANGEGPLVIVKGTTSGVGYLHYPDGHSEPIGRGSLGIEPVPKGMLITEDAGHVVFQSFNLGFRKAVQLEPNAPPEGIPAVYDRTIDPITGEEQTHVVSLLPGDLTPSENATYKGASKDGEGIAFAIAADSEGIGGTLYLRKNNTITYAIGEDLTFAGVSEGGGRIFYVEEGNLKAFDTSTEAVIPFSESGDVTPVNVAPGGTRAYFTSPSQLGGTNPEGELPIEGAQNLYLSEEGQVSFIGVLTDFDVEGDPLNANDGLEAWTHVLSSRPALDPSRTNPDGSVLLFTSRAKLGAYDPEGAPEVYRYDSKEPSLECLSCIPTGAPAGAGAAIQTYSTGNADPSPLNPFNFLPGLTPDGERAFFESTEALVSADTDGKRDVYEWEAQGVGSCTRAGGCVYLISSGHSATEDFLYAQSTDGDNVFFTSGDRLLPEEDPSATPSIYDARVNGGFATATAAGECLGEACQPAAVPPTESSLASTTFQGPGNVTPRQHSHKHKRHHKRRNATKHRRASR